MTKEVDYEAHTYLDNNHHFMRGQPIFSAPNSGDVHERTSQPCA